VAKDGVDGFTRVRNLYTTCRRVMTSFTPGRLWPFAPIADEHGKFFLINGGGVSNNLVGRLGNTWFHNRSLAFRISGRRRGSARARSGFEEDGRAGLELGRRRQYRQDRG